MRNEIIELIEKEIEVQVSKPSLLSFSINVDSNHNYIT